LIHDLAEAGFFVSGEGASAALVFEASKFDQQGKRKCGRCGGSKGRRMGVRGLFFGEVEFEAKVSEVVLYDTGDGWGMDADG